MKLAGKQKAFPLSNRQMPSFCISENPAMENDQSCLSFTCHSWKEKDILEISLCSFGGYRTFSSENTIFTVTPCPREGGKIKNT